MAMTKRVRRLMLFQAARAYSLYGNGESHDAKDAEDNLMQAARDFARAADDEQDELVEELLAVAKKPTAKRRGRKPRANVNETTPNAFPGHEDDKPTNGALS